MFGRRRPSRADIKPFAAIIPGSIALLVIVSLIVLSVVISGTATQMPSHNFSASAAFPSDTPAQGLLNPDSEVRGVWIASVENINYPSKPGLSLDELKAELDTLVREVKALNLNAIYFQVRPSSDALYDSALFPVSEYLTGDQSKLAPGGFDPLAYLLDIAHSQNIAVHAWVNPLRVTSGTADEPNHDITKLAPNNPARMFPDWVVPYADGKLYYNAGVPGVRELVAAGVAEIVTKYDVDGIIFDDYFYPYPVTGAKFDDNDEFKLYGNGMKLDAWRRENINLMVRDCYVAIKSIDPDCQFGIAPFGIWQNDNGKNGGSDTKGMESYSAIYCDPLAWIEGGYIDYIAPQIYWQFSNSSARYDTLVRWWNEQLEGHDNVELLICHAAYRSAEWGTENEIRNQVEFARSERSYRGSIFYGWAAVQANDMGLKEQISSLYTDTIIYGPHLSNGQKIVVNSPLSGSYINETNTYLLGSSDPAYPLYLDGKAVTRTKDGYFSLYVSLKRGKNEFVFTQNGSEYVHTINRGTYVDNSPKTYAELDSFTISSYAPTCNYMVSGGTKISLSATAPSGSTVTAALGGQTVRLSATVNPPKNGNYMAETYTGSITLPSIAKAGEIVELGNIVYTAKRGNESATVTGSRVRVAGSGATVTIEVQKDDSELKLSKTSWYYDDYTPASKGMRDAAVSLSDGYYKTSMGAYIAEEDVAEVDRTVVIA
nr:family 10 glycosylhydrolase [Clostridia bacterium]